MGQPIKIRNRIAHDLISLSQRFEPFVPEIRDISQALNYLEPLAQITQSHFPIIEKESPPTKKEQEQPKTAPAPSAQARPKQLDLLQVRRKVPPAQKTTSSSPLQNKEVVEALIALKKQATRSKGPTQKKPVATFTAENQTRGELAIKRSPNPSNAPRRTTPILRPTSAQKSKPNA